MSKYVWILAMGLLAAVGCLAQARDLSGVRLQEVVRLSPNVEPVRLNGATVKRLAAHPLYVGGLYLAEPGTSLQDVLQNEGPKRILLFCKTSSIGSDMLIRTFDQGITINNPPELVQKLRDKIDTFQNVWRNNPLKKGDEVWIDYIPNQGTRVAINGQVKASIPGREFYDAFLRAWLGKYPVNPRLKKAMLRGKAKRLQGR